VPYAGSWGSPTEPTGTEPMSNAGSRVAVLGVSGSGKTTLARALAADTGAVVVDADDLHPEANVEKMAAGIPLTDADRRPWLEAVAEVLARHRAAGSGLVVACSALKRRYRDLLRTGDPDLVCLLLAGPRAALERRVRERRDHFMPAGLLGSQLATLEPLEDDERGVTLDLTQSLPALVGAARAAIGAAQDSGQAPRR
jgi:gluconokinase